jgi:hypothetical protein
MPRQYDEKRDAVRVDVDCPIMFRPEDNGGNDIGKVRNLSGRGMMFISQREVPVESHLEVRIQPEDDTSLHARVRVVRVARPRRGEGFEIGAVIQEMLDE